MAVVAQSFAEAGIIAFPEQNALVCAATTRQRIWYSSEKMRKSIYSWLIVGILRSNGSTPLEQMTNVHLRCEDTGGEGDLYITRQIEATMSTV